MLVLFIPQVDDANIAFTGRHLNGYGAWPKEELNASINTFQNLLPFSKLSKIAGIGTKTLNAGQFNKLFSGSNLLKGSQKLRGETIRVHNHVIKQAESGRNAAFQIGLFTKLFNGTSNK